MRRGGLGIPRSKVSTPPVHVRYATVEVSDSKNRALSPTRFAYRYIIAFHYSSLRSKHEILPILNVRTRLTPRFQTPQRRQFRPVSLRTTRRCRETGADRVAENRAVSQHRAGAGRRLGLDAPPANQKPSK